MQDKDKLARFIQENRQEFDLKEPKRQVWKGIESKLKPVQATTLWYWKAAVFLLIGAVGFLLTDKFLPESETIISIEQQEALATSNLEKFEELEVFYSSIIFSHLAFSSYLSRSATLKKRDFFSFYFFLG